MNRELSEEESRELKRRKSNLDKQEPKDTEISLERDNKELNSQGPYYDSYIYNIIIDRLKELKKNKYEDLGIDVHKDGNRYLKNFTISNKLDILGRINIELGFSIDETKMAEHINRTIFKYDTENQLENKKIMRRLGNKCIEFTVDKRNTKATKSGIFQYVISDRQRSNLIKRVDEKISNVIQVQKVENKGTSRYSRKYDIDDNIADNIEKIVDIFIETAIEENKRA